jgi:2-dehydropantoate 2-reductase
VGGYFGTRLAQGGCDVGFVARGDHLAALVKNGLRIESKLGDIYLPEVRASDNPAALGPADLVLISVKLWDTDTAIRAIKPIVDRGAFVISFQNGVHKEEILRRTFGEKAVIGGVCYIASKIISPGVIKHTGSMQKLIFGEIDGQPSDRTRAFLEACRRSGIEAEISSDIRRAIWEKFVFLVGVSASTTTMRATIGPIRTNPRTRAFLLDTMREVVAVGRAHGVQLDQDFAENRLAFCDGLPPEMTSSMHTDLEEGKPLEVDWLSGAVVALGKAVAVQTPLNRAVDDILALRAEGARGKSQRKEKQ